MFLTYYEKEQAFSQIFCEGVFFLPDDFQEIN